MTRVDGLSASGRGDVTARMTVRNLKVRYSEVLALECTSADLVGNKIAVIGHNGAGKSTFIKTTLGLLQPTLGGVTVTIDGRPEPLRPERDMAFCPETGSVFSDISVENYVKLWCRFKKRDGNYYRKAGARYLELLDLPPLLPKLGRELSKGQRRRVQTAVGFLSGPALFLFDEPFDGLDVQKSHELTGIIEDHSDVMSFVITSHRMDVVERLADFILVLKDGRFVCLGTTADVCTELGGSTVMAQFDENLAAARTVLLAAYPEAVVNVIGSQISLTGKALGAAQVTEDLRARGVPPSHVEEVRPSLVDAMNFHLKG